MGVWLSANLNSRTCGGRAEDRSRVGVPRGPGGVGGDGGRNPAACAAEVPGRANENGDRSPNLFMAPCGSPSPPPSPDEGAGAPAPGAAAPGAAAWAPPGVVGAPAPAPPG